MRHGGALARFGLGFVATLLGFDEPALEFALRGALAARRDRDAAGAVEDLERSHRRAFADHRRLVQPAIRALRGEALDPAAWRTMAATALHALRADRGALGGALAGALDEAWRAAERGDDAGVLRALDQAAGAVPEALRGVLGGIAEVYGGERRERLPASTRTGPPAGFDLDRGRESRADLVIAVLRARDVQLRSEVRTPLRGVTRDEIAEAILRDPRWDDIDASVGEDGVVARVLRGDRPSPPIDLGRFALPVVTIARIVR